MKSNDNLTLDLLCQNQIEEHFEERAAIYEYLGDKEREEAELLAAKDTEAFRFSCEVDSVVRMYNNNGGDFVKSYLLKVEKARGSEAAGRLRTAALDRLRLDKLDKRK